MQLWTGHLSSISERGRQGLVVLWISYVLPGRSHRGLPICLYRALGWELSWEPLGTLWPLYSEVSLPGHMTLNAVVVTSDFLHGASSSSPKPATLANLTALFPKPVISQWGGASFTFHWKAKMRLEELAQNATRFRAGNCNQIGPCGALWTDMLHPHVLHLPLVCRNCSFLGLPLVFLGFPKE